MKNFTLTILLALITLTIHAAPKIIAQNNGRWARANSWDQLRIPQNGDTVVIPSNYELVVDNNNSLNNVIIIVYGTLKFDNGKLSLDETSKILLESTGLITGSGSNDWIRIDNSIVYKGSNGDLKGPAYADINTGSGFVSLSILPVQFLSFNTHKANGKIKLTWSTDNEINNSHFNIEKSVDGKSWQVIGMVFAKESGNVNSYEFIDGSKQESNSYYRIQQVDRDGAVSYSRVQVIREQQVQNLANIYSPAKNSVRVKFEAPVSSSVEVRVFNANGQMMGSKSASLSSTSVDLTMNNIRNGAYVVQVLDQNGLIESRKIVL